jgi:hypothetical protein
MTTSTQNENLEIHFVVYYSTKFNKWIIADDTQAYLPDGDTWNDDAQEWSAGDDYDDLRRVVYQDLGQRISK